ncbi:MAG TPA: purine-nucleoside phosphorylase [Candidatus Aquicultor sp.]
MDLIDQVRQGIKDASRYITDRVEADLDIGIILGSGLGAVVDAVEDAAVFPYSEMPHFPKSTVEGHKGNLVIGELGGKRVGIMQGRFHYYEGYTATGIVFPVRLLKALGAKVLIVTCAAGGLRADFRPGDIMAITDHINFLGTNPLVGSNDEELGPRFVDMAEAYNRELLGVARQQALAIGVDLQEGVYIAVLGPSYETPAEIKLFTTYADAVGMSTVPEVIAARHMGMRVLGLAVITNTPGAEQVISHDEVLVAAQRSSEKLSRLIINIVGQSTVE